ncbi:MAG: hypothetical protein OSA89_11005 [Mariniblastus sp.]|jgi:hypothetical protein|nr:hypothetical protein [Mariniblastus sp.]|tara:strand:+ start:477 stop:641 length:165 start_codon:yes stop_codon:yes gene_type:complete
MGSFTQSIGSFARQVSQEMGEITQSLTGTGWATLSIALLISGWYFLSGNSIKTS